MTFLKKIFFAIVAIALILVVIGFVLPKSRHVERSIVIEAPAGVVFAKVNGFKHFNDWSPFLAAVPGADYSFDGPDFGVGSRISWVVAEPKADAGSQTIVASTPYERIDVELDLGAQGSAQSAYLLQKVDAGTRVTWTFDTDFGFNLIRRYRGILLDRQIGALYAQGLANLKRISEELPAIDWSDMEISITEVASTTIAYTTGSCGTEPTEIAAALGAAYGRVVGFITTNGLQLAGQPLSIANYWDERGYSFDAGIPVAGSPARGVGPDSATRMGETYGGRVVKAVHVGSYTDLSQTYETIEAFLIVHKLERNGRSWDIYVSDPGDTPEEELITEVYYPVK